MKKLFYLCSLLILTVLASCGTPNTPSDVAKAGYKCLKNTDYAGYVDLLLTNEDGKISLGPRKGIEKEELVKLLNDKAGQEADKDGGIKSYEVVSEVITDDGELANVKMTVTYGNGTVKDDIVKLRKDADGQWKICPSK